MQNEDQTADKLLLVLASLGALADELEGATHADLPEQASAVATILRGFSEMASEIIAARGKTEAALTAILRASEDDPTSAP